MFGRARLRLTVWYAASFLLVLVVLGGGTYVAVTRLLDGQLDEGISASLIQWESTAPDPRIMPAVPTTTGAPLDNDDVFVLAFRTDGTLVANPRSLDAALVAELAGFGSTAASTVRSWRTVSVGHTRFRLLIDPLRADGSTAGTAVAGRSLGPRDAEVQGLAIILMIAAAFGALCSAGGGYLLAGRALHPLAEAHERQRAFVTDASHELRSPLAVIRASAELLLRRPMPEEERVAAGDIRDVSDELGRLIDQLLELARFGSGTATAPAPSTVDLADAVQSGLHQFRTLLQQHETAVATDLQRAPARISADEVHRILRALLENVLVHTPPGTDARIETAIDGGSAVLVVEDAGPGIPAGFVGDMFGPFIRVDAARTPGSGAGSGLGLAIVQAIVQRHGGSVAAQPRAGRGLRVEVRLPRAE